MSQIDRPIMVSVICITYNHGPYIQDALEGFVNQKTNFAYEVVVHDDASTDDTAQIIRRYQEKYPDLIHPIYQTENQYSRNMNFIEELLIPRARGQYLALCEGDDYWTDPGKLQKQFDAMQAHPEVDICAHDAAWVRGGKTIGHTDRSPVEAVLSANDVIASGGGFVDSASIFFRREILEHPPEFFRVLPFFDYSLQIFCALRGGLLYLPDCMAVTRIAVPGSWTVRVSRNQTEMIFREVGRMLDQLNEDTQGRFQAAIQERKRAMLFDLLEARGDYKALREGEMGRIYQTKPMKWKILVFVKEHCPGLYAFYLKTRGE